MIYHSNIIDIISTMRVKFSFSIARLIEVGGIKYHYVTISPECMPFHSLILELLSYLEMGYGP